MLRKMIPFLNIDWQGVPPVASREAEVLSLIGKEDLTLFTFDGLKRRLGLHPETLSRILSRLEQEGVIKKEVNGYKVNHRITKVRLREPYPEEPHVPLLQTYLPSNIQVQQVITDLRGKWFGLLRWFGITEDNQGVILKWVTEDGGMQINAVIKDSTLTIDATFLRDNNLNLALSASYQLIAYIGRVFSAKRKRATHVSYFGDMDAFLMSA